AAGRSDSLRRSPLVRTAPLAQGDHIANPARAGVSRLLVWTPPVPPERAESKGELTKNGLRPASSARACSWRCARLPPPLPERASRPAGPPPPTCWPRNRLFPGISEDTLRLQIPFRYRTRPARCPRGGARRGRSSCDPHQDRRIRRSE